MSYEPEPYEGPDIVVLWDKVHAASRPHLCDRCNAEIAVGASYENRGWREDGEFKTEKVHRFAYSYPSGCPSIGEKDRAEAEAQFLAEQAEFYPTTPARSEERRAGE